MKFRGLFLIGCAVALPLIGFAPFMARNGEAAFSQYLGAVSLILMGIVQLQATRFRGIEAIFGSMDRIYVLHKWLAVIAIVTGYLHSIIDADMGGIEGRWSDAAEDIAEVGLNGLIFLVIVSLITIIPYKYWKWSHRLMGAFFATLAFHFIYIEKPFAVGDPLGLYITAFCVMGVGSYLYTLLPRFLGVNTRKYRVAAVQKHNSAIEIQLKPEGRSIQHQAGQFAFVNFQPVMLQEVHPFTISSAPDASGSLTFMVKGLGSYTKRLSNTLEQGTVAWVSQPFGHFSLKETNGAQIWIGAGIGITPFLAWADSLPDNWSSPSPSLLLCPLTRGCALCRKVGSDCGAG